MTENWHSTWSSWSEDLTHRRVCMAIYLEDRGMPTTQQSHKKRKEKKKKRHELCMEWNEAGGRDRQWYRVASSWNSARKGWEGELASGLNRVETFGNCLVSWWPRRVEVAFIWYWWNFYWLCVFIFPVRLMDWSIVVVFPADGAGISVCCWFRVFKSNCGWLMLLGWRDGLWVKAGYRFDCGVLLVVKFRRLD